MAKWRRGRRSYVDARTLAHMDYMRQRQEGLPLGAAPLRPLADMSAAGNGAVMFSQENLEEASAVDDDAVDSVENTD